MLKELGLVVTGVTIGVVGTLYVTKDFLIEGFAHKLSEVIDEEVQDMKDEIYNEQVEKDNKRDYTKPLRKYGKYPWGVQVDRDNKRDYTKPLRKSGKYPWGEHTNQRKDKAFTTTYEAFTILDAMTQHCNTYGQVTLADYYELIGQIPTNVDDDYGWTDLSGATIDKIESGGYTIHMPLAKKLNK